MKKYKIFYLLFIVSLFVLFFSFYKIINWHINNKNTENQLKIIKEVTNIDYIDDDIRVMTVDFNELLKINNETTAWINIPGTEINYPVVKHNDNDYYLNHSFDKSYNSAGWVYMDYRNDINKLSKNTVFYAHSMLNRTMFGSLRDVTKEDYLNNNKHYIYISTPKYNYVFEIFSAYHLYPDNNYIKVNFSDNEFSNWIKDIKEKSMVNYNVNVSEKDYVFTLSTCWNNSERFAVHSKLIKIEKNDHAKIFN